MHTRTHMCVHADRALGPVGEDDGDAVAVADGEGGELGGEVAREEGAQLAVRARLAPRLGRDERGQRRRGQQVEQAAERGQRLGGLRGAERAAAAAEQS